jgi:hypothetical protein
LQGTQVLPRAWHDVLDTYASGFQLGHRPPLITVVMDFCRAARQAGSSAGINAG